MKRIAWGLLVVLALAGCASNGSGASRSATGRGPTATRSSAPASVPPAGCRTSYRSKALPRWARAGFSGSRPSVPYVLGDQGDIAAVVWVSHHPLAAPPVAGKNNKILWVARSGAGPLQIRATLEGTTQTVTRTIDSGPGPSVIDLPSPGCWSFDLTWGRHHDQLRLAYAPG